MSRFIWMLRREIWEHKAIWIAPLIVLGCLLATALFGRVHLGPLGEVDRGLSPFASISQETLTGIVTLVYAGLTVAMFAVLGIISFFYSLDSLYADRRDRSVLFWKSLPLSDAETVLSKFAVATVVIPLVALVGAVASHFLVAGAVSIKLSMAGLPAGFLWNAQAILGGIVVSLLWCLMAMLWYAPVVGYLMLASAWAPRGPFLWAVLPPVAIVLLERVLFYSEYAADFIALRIFGPIHVLEGGGDADPKTDAEVRAAVEKLADRDLLANLADFFQSADLWLGVIAAGLLIAAAMWVRRYRDETA
ncbi:MAG: ABC-2 transporter permease [Gammaproteobacteria bacterium]